MNWKNTKNNFKIKAIGERDFEKIVATTIDLAFLIIKKINSKFQKKKSKLLIP